MTATRAYSLRNVADAFISGLIFTSLSVYYVRTVGLRPFELLLIGTVLMIVTLLFEVPTGVIADVYGRKRSVLIGGALIGMCFLVVGLIPVFWVVLAAALIEAIGNTCISGALEAWLTDEIAAEGGDSTNVSAVIIRAEQLGSPAHWCGIGASVLLATLASPGAAVALGGGLWLLSSIGLWFTMPERGFVRRAPAERQTLRDHARAAVRTLASGAALVRRSPVLMLLFAAALFYGAFFEPFFRLYQAHLLQAMTLPEIVLPVLGRVNDVIWIGALDAAVTLLYLPASELQRRAISTTAGSERGIARALAIGFGVALVCSVVFALTGAFWLAVCAFLVLKVALLLTEPLTVVWRNQHISPEIRATVLSMNSQVNVLGQLGGGLGIGALGNRWGTRAALGLAGLFLLPVIALYARGGSRSSSFNAS